MAFNVVPSSQSDMKSGHSSAQQEVPRTGKQKTYHGKGREEPYGTGCADGDSMRSRQKERPRSWASPELAALLYSITPTAGGLYLVSPRKSGVGLEMRSQSEEVD